MYIGIWALGSMDCAPGPPVLQRQPQSPIYLEGESKHGWTDWNIQNSNMLCI